MKEIGQNGSATMRPAGILASGPDGVPLDSIHVQIERILANRRFTSSERHSRLLRYLLQKTLDGRGGELKEYALGVDVFDRRDSFDPQTDPIVRTELSRLRSRLKEYYESDGRDDNLIVDLPKRTYSLTFHVRETMVASTVAKQPRQGIAGKWKWLVLAACAFSIAGFWGLVRANDQRTPREEPDRDLASIAVLPFANLSDGRDGERFADGLTEDVIQRLAEVDGLRVVSRTSAFQFKGKHVDLRAVAAQLNVELVLEGAVQRSAGRLRVTTRLIDAVDGYELRSDVYERVAEDMLAVQAEIAQQVANRLRDASSKKFTNSAEAYRLYLKGRRHARKRSEFALRKAIDCYESALAADAAYSPAHAGLADAHMHLALLNEASPGEAMQRASQAAHAAVKTGDAFSLAHAALGSVLSLHRWDWVGAEKEFQRAIDLDPQDGGIREAYAIRCLLPQGRLDSALDQMQRAQALDPFSPGIVLGLGKVQHFKRDPEGAIETYQRLLQLEPGFEAAPLALAKAYVQRSQADQALKTLSEASAPTGYEARLAILGYAYALSRQPDRARKVLEDLQNVARRQYVSGYYFALVHAALGENTKALDWLETAANQHCPRIVYLKVNPLFDGLRTEPRFASLLKRAGLG